MSIGPSWPPILTGNSTKNNSFGKRRKGLRPLSSLKKYLFICYFTNKKCYHICKVQFYGKLLQIKLKLIKFLEDLGLL